MHNISYFPHDRPSLSVRRRKSLHEKQITLSSCIPDQRLRANRATRPSITLGKNDQQLYLQRSVTRDEKYAKTSSQKVLHSYR